MFSLSFNLNTQRSLFVQRRKALYGDEEGWHAKRREKEGERERESGQEIIMKNRLYNIFALDCLDLRYRVCAMANAFCWCWLFSFSLSLRCRMRRLPCWGYSNFIKYWTWELLVLLCDKWISNFFCGHRRNSQSHAVAETRANTIYSLSSSSTMENCISLRNVFHENVFSEEKTFASWVFFPIGSRWVSVTMLRRIWNVCMLAKVYSSLVNVLKFQKCFENK